RVWAQAGPAGDLLPLGVTTALAAAAAPHLVPLRDDLVAGRDHHFDGVAVGDDLPLAAPLGDLAAVHVGDRVGGVARPGREPESVERDRAHLPRRLGGD